MTEKLQFFLDPVAEAAGVTFQPPAEGDAGFDLRAAEAVQIPAGGQLIVSTKLKMAIPFGWVGIVKDRSSMASRRIYSHGGVIDAGYRGEVKILLSNSGDTEYPIEIGDKIAQMVILPCLVSAEQVSDISVLGETARNTLGFGSTGRR